MRGRLLPMSNAACHVPLSAPRSWANDTSASRLALNSFSTVASAAASALAALNDPQEWPAFSKEVTGYEGVWESHLVVQGMHCAACAMTVEQLLRQVPGVRSARVNSASQRASVIWDSARVLPAPPLPSSTPPRSRPHLSSEGR
jgi:Cu2+-exporting ATPase